MIRTELGMLNTNLLRRQLLSIVVEYSAKLDMDPFPLLEEVTQEPIMHPYVVEPHKIVCMRTNVMNEGDPCNEK